MCLVCKVCDACVMCPHACVVQGAQRLCGVHMCVPVAQNPRLVPRALLTQQLAWAGRPCERIFIGSSTYGIRAGSLDQAYEKSIMSAHPACLLVLHYYSQS